MAIARFSRGLRHRRHHRHFDELYTGIIDLRASISNETIARTSHRYCGCDEAICDEINYCQFAYQLHHWTVLINRREAMLNRRRECEYFGGASLLFISASSITTLLPGSMRAHNVILHLSIDENELRRRDTIFIDFISCK